MASWSEAFPGTTAPANLGDPNVAGVSDNTWVTRGQSFSTQFAQIGAGGGGITELTTLKANRLAVWGRELTEFDSGRITFDAARVDGGDSANIAYGVHFCTDQGDETENDNNGYAVLVQPRRKRLILPKVVAGDVQTPVLAATGNDALTANDEIEVVFGPKSVTGASHRILVNYPGGSLTSDDAAYIVGRLGLCGDDQSNPGTNPISVGGANFLTFFEFEEFGKPLADYGTDADSTYKGVAGRLYEFPASTFSNTVPATLRAAALRAAERLQPLIAVKPTIGSGGSTVEGIDAVAADFARGRAELEHLRAPVDDILESQLKPRLVRLLTNRQRAHAASKPSPP